MRKSGLEILGDIEWGTHLCQFYQTPQDLVDVLVPYFKQGLLDNEFCMWVTSEPLRVEEATAALKAEVPDLEERMNRGQIEIIDYSRWYTAGGRFDADRVLNGWVEKLSNAREKGYEGLRLTGNTFWLEQKDWRDFVAYEEQVGSVIGKHRMIALCTYSLAQCSPSEIIDVVSTHQLALIKRDGKWESIESSERRLAEEARRKNEERVRAKLQALLSPEGDIGLVELADLIDAPALQSLLENLYELSGLPVGILDLQGNVLVGVGWQEICTKFHRASPEASRHCTESDTELSAGIPPGEIRLYKCKNNMWDIATPITVGGQHVGNVFLGQFFFEGEPLDYELFRAQARRYGFDEQEYIAALEAVPRFSREFVERGMAFFRDLAQMLSQASYSNLKLARSLAERDALTASLRESERRLNRAQEMAHLGSWELDLVNDTLTWSDEVYRIFGLQPQEFGATYQAFLAAVHPDDRAAVDAAYAGSLREGRDSYEIEHRIVRKPTGEVRVIHEKCEHIRDGSGRIIRSVGMVHDITERKRAEEALLQTVDELGRSNRELEQFAYIASHDLQTPLRSVTGFLDLLSRRYQGKISPEADQFIGYAVEGAERMHQLINDILAYSRVSTCGKPFERLDSGEPLARALENLKTEIKESRAEIEVEELPAVTGDRSQLAQLFQNLVGNALKYRRQDQPPRIHITAEEKDGEWKFRVRDNGIGFDPGHAERIFQIFQRLHTAGEYPGTGIGLAICRKIVERHHGRIGAESKPGTGSTFFFTLPKS